MILYTVFMTLPVVVYRDMATRSTPNEVRGAVESETESLVLFILTLSLVLGFGGVTVVLGVNVLSMILSFLLATSLLSLLLYGVMKIALRRALPNR